LSYQLESLRILIVDDYAHIRQLLRTILYAVGIRAIGLAEEVVSGFDSLCRLDYDLVFTDYQMEPISGLDLVDMIRTSHQSPNPYIPIIMISAYSDEERVQLARSSRTRARARVARSEAISSNLLSFLWIGWRVNHRRQFTVLQAAAIVRPCPFIS